MHIENCIFPSYSRSAHTLETAKSSLRFNESVETKFIELSVLCKQFYTASCNHSSLYLNSIVIFKFSLLSDKHCHMFNNKNKLFALVSR